MAITATELKQNLSEYLLTAEREDVYITSTAKSSRTPIRTESIWKDFCLASSPAT